jgi:hypothetical protein
MAKRNLIVYASKTGNTEKVAFRFKSTFEKIGWESDIFKVTSNMDFGKLPFDYKNYDFLCIGTPTVYKSPCEEIKKILFPPHPDLPPKPAVLPPGTPVELIKFGPDDRKGIVFATYGGLYMGKREVEPVLSYASVMMEWALKFQCVGVYSCPGSYPAHSGWVKDLNQRPSERDLQAAEIFIEEVIEENYYNGR